MPNSPNHQHKTSMFKGKTASQNMAQAIVLAAHEASVAAVQGKAALSACTANVPRARMLGPTNSFQIWLGRGRNLLGSNLLDFVSI